MAITRYAGDRFTIAPTDTKPTGVMPGAFLIDSGNQTSFVKTGYTIDPWAQIAGGGGGGTPGGADTQVQFNNNGSFGGDADLTFTNGDQLNVKKLSIAANVIDSNSSIGEGGMVLTNEGTTGVNWKSIESVLSGVGGSGVENYVARWSDEDTLTSGTIYDDGSRVGIGTTGGSGGKLQVYNGNIMIDQSAALYYYKVQLKGPIAQFFGGSRLFDGHSYNSAGSAEVARTWFTHDSNGVFSIAHIDTGNPLPRLSIKTDGKVGIGTTNAATKLHLYDSSDVYLTLESSGGTTEEVAIKYNNFTTGTDFWWQGLNQEANYSLAYGSTYTGANIKFFVGTDAKVGIGTNSVYANLHIVSASSSAWLRLDRATTSSNSGIIFRTVGNETDGAWAVYMDATEQFRIADWTGTDVTRLLIDTSGKVGIGTDAPFSILHTNDGSGAIYHLTRTSGSIDGTLGVIRFGNTNIDSNLAGINAIQDGATDNAKITFTTQAAIGPGTIERMVIKSDGKVGIGTTNPQSILHVYGNYASMGDGTYAAAFGRGNSLIGGQEPSDFVIASLSSKDLVLSTSSADRLHIKADGNVGIGDNLIAPEHRLHVSGDAIISGVLYDSINSSGESGYVLTSEVGGPQWQMIEDVLSGVGGNGTANYVPRWEDSDTIGDSLIYDDATNVGIGTANPQRLLHVNGDAIVSGKFYDQTNSTGDKGYVLTSDDNGPLWKASGDFDGLSGNLITTGQTLQTQITSNDTDIAANTANLITTGQTLQTQITSNDGDITTLTSNLITTGQTLQTQITSNDTDIATNVTNIATNVTNLITTGQYLTDEIDTVSGLIPSVVIDGAGVSGYTARWFDGNTLTSGVIQDNGTAVGINQAPDSNCALAIKSIENNENTFQLSADDSNALFNIRQSANDCLIRGYKDGNVQNIQIHSDGVSYLKGGNFGIGISPTETLHVYDGDPKIFIDNSNASSGASRSKIKFGNSGTTYMEIGHLYDSTAGDNAIQILDPAAGGTPLVTFKKDGKVGIGTTNPGYLLHLKAATADISVQSTTGTNRTGFQAGNTGGYSYFYRESSGGGAAFAGTSAYATIVGGTGAYPLHLGTNSLVRMTITSTGNVGIGITNPSSLLQLKSDGTLMGGSMTVMNSGGNQARFYAGLDGNEHGYLSLVENDGTTGGLYLTGNSAGTNWILGKVGIGTNTPDNTLHVFTASAGSVTASVHGDDIVVENSGRAGISILTPANSLGSLYFGSPTSDDRGAIRYDHGEAVTDRMEFIVAGVGRMYIISDGNVGIGTTAPRKPLQIAGSVQVDFTESNTPSADRGIIGKSSYWAINSNVAHAFVLNMYNSNTILPALVVTQTGKVGIGSTAPYYKLEVRGDYIFVDSDKGIRFGGSSHQVTRETGNELRLKSANTTGFITFLTGGGSEYMRIAADGNVGIADTGPSAKLTVVDTKTANYNGAGASVSSTWKVLRLGNPAVTATYATPGVGIDFSAGDSDSARCFIVAKRSGAGDGDLIFGTSSNNGTNYTEAMVVRHDGNVGIGDNLVDPEHRLHVSGDAIISGVLYDSINSSGAAGHVFTSEVGGPQWKMIEDVLSGVGGNGTADYVPRWIDSDTIGNSLIYDNGSNIGIGTNDPSGTLNLYSSAVNDPRLKITNTYATVGMPRLEFIKTRGTSSLVDADVVGQISFMGQNEVGDIQSFAYIRGIVEDISAKDGALAFASVDNGGSIERMRILSDGKVGIGTTAPTRMFQINSANTKSYIALTNSTTGSAVSDGAALGQEGNDLYLWNYEAGLIYMGTSNTTRLTIKSDGKVGIGTNNPLSLLHLTQAAGANIRFTNSTTGNYFQIGEGVGGDNKFSFRGWSYRTTDTLTVDFANNRVGINNIAPATTLDVNGVTTARDYIGLGAASINGQITWLTSSPARLILFGASGRKLSLGSDGAYDKVTLDLNGNVGIGITNPAQLLSVEGSKSGAWITKLKNTHATNGNGLLVQAADNNDVKVVEFRNLAETSTFTMMGDGKVGVGSDDPRCILNVSKAYTTGYGVEDCYLMLGGQEAQANSTRLIGFGYIHGTSTHPPANIGFLQNSNDGFTNGDLIFRTRETTTNVSPTERMRILSDGKVGIGITNPSSLLQLKSDGTLMGGSMTVMNSGANQARFYAGLDGNEHGYLSLVENDGTTGGLYLTGNGAGTNWILGDVGIGTASPANGILVVNHLATSTPTNNIELMGSSLVNNGGTAIFFKASSNTTLNRYGARIHSIRDATASNGATHLVFSNENAGATSLDEHMRIQHDGNVGIGTTDPDQKLSVAGNIQARSGGWFIARSADNAGYSYLKNPTTSGSAIAFHTSGEKMRLLSNGRVGIGITNPDRQVQIYHATQAELKLNTNGALLGGLIYYNDSETKFLMRAQETDGHISFQTGGTTERMRIQADGALDLISAKLLINGGGGTAGYHLQTDGSGNISWQAGGAGTVTGTGTNNYIASWNGTTALEVANIYKHAYGTIINSNYLTSYATNRYVFEVSGNPGTTAFDGGIINLRVTSDTNGDRVGQLAFINAGNANHVNPNAAAGSRIAQIISTLVTTDSNAGDDSGGDLQFWTKAEAGLPAERMRIQSDGKVGIGTTNPLYDLHIKDAEASMRVDSTTGTNRVGYQMGNTGGTTYFMRSSSTGTGILTSGALNYATVIANSGSTYAIQFGTNDIARMTILGGGNVGIGTNAPNSLFQLDAWAHLDTNYGQLSMFGGMYWNGSAMVRSAGGTRKAAGMYMGTGGDFFFITAPETSGTTVTLSDRLVIKNDGKVGIGVAPTASTTILTLGGSLATGGIYINSGVDEDHTIIDMTGITGGGKLIWDDTEEAFSMSKGLRVTAGKVGIGITNPSSLLQLKSDGTLMGGSMTVMNSGGNQARFYAGLDGNEHGYVSLVENDGTTGGLYLTGNSAGTNWILGKLGIGRTAPSTKLVVNGTFDASATPSVSAPSANTANKGILITREAASGWGIGHTYGIDFGAANSIDAASQYKVAAIYGAVESVPYYVAGKLGFYTTAGTNGALLTERMSIKGDGKVGIGTTNPGGYLHVNGSGNSKGIYVTSAATTLAAVQVEADSLTTGYAGYFYSYSADTSTRSLVWIRNDNALSTGTTALKISQDSTGPALVALGNVGIGSATPATALDVVGEISGLSSGYNTLTRLSADPSGTGTVLSLMFDCSGTPADGRGVRLTMGGSTSTTDGITSMLLDVPWTDVTHATRTSDFVIQLLNSGTLAEKFRITGAGKLKLNTYGSGTHTGTTAYSLAVDSSGNVIEFTGGTGTVTGTGTANYISKWTGTSSQGNSSIHEAGAGSLQIEGPSAGRFLTLNAPTTGGYITFETADTAFADIGTAKSISGNAAYSTTDLMINTRSGAKNIVFGMNGVEKVRIDNNGKVGIGTTAPGSPLHVKDSVDNSDTSGITIERSANTQKGYINMRGGGLMINVDSGLPIKFKDGGTTNMTILGDGKVGIGIAAPLAMLHIAKSNSTAYSPTRTNAQTVTDAANGLIIENTNIGTGRFSVLTFEGHPYDAPTYDYAQIGAKWTSDGNSELFFKTEDAGDVREVMRITDTGNVGIGITNPSSLLQLKSDGTLMGGSMTVMNSGGNQARFYAGLDGNEHGYLSLVENDGTTGGLYLTGNSAGTNWVLGAMGIGTASPYGKLEVAQATAFTTVYNANVDNIVLTRDATTGSGNYGGSIGFSPIDSPNERMAAIASVQTATDTNQMGLALFTHPSATGGNPIVEAMRIKHDGNVGIGTTAPGSYKLRVEGDSIATGDTYVYNNKSLYVLDNSGHKSLQITNHSSGSNSPVFSADPANSAAGTIMYWWVDAAEKMSLDSGGNLSIQGTLTEASSLAIKENIETYSPSLEMISKIRPVRFNKKKSKKKEVGLVAEELAEMFPELVERDEKGNPAGVNYSRAVAVLLHGFKELYKEVKELKEKI